MAGKAQNVVALVATLGVTAVAKKAVDATWKIGSGGKEPPTDPADPDIEVREAIVWAVVSGAAISVARMFLARRLARNERRTSRVTKAVHP
ncbi:DUF4235 domain-containing protein [Nocardioides marmoribigeumensis]|jgi:hypothetical protein|uniref:DUF4235 domain-containing protein n=1 Tax=Nocardioides marmoribigeumensis TaxID=433649 RepID=A0ABU2BT28_9ACTN|nr:DUF4235 domain-containing protein [Nocardioides marmoribigeumensis]MDR7361154.1 hypothetical protein [Nocardioides marmoribigeumensis]